MLEERNTNISNLKEQVIKLQKGLIEASVIRSFSQGMEAQTLWLKTKKEKENEIKEVNYKVREIEIEIKGIENSKINYI